MISIRDLVDMICTEAVTGSDDSCVDYARTFPPAQSPSKRYTSRDRGSEDLPPINLGLELIEEPNGAYRWVEENIFF